VDLLKQKIDLKTVITCLVFIAGLIANNLKTEYTIKVLIIELENKDKIHDLQIQELKDRK
jgi:hypothetical protein